MLHMTSIFYPGLEAAVKFKRLSPEDAEAFIDRFEDDEVGKSAFKKAALETMIYNFRSDIMPKVRQMPQQQGEPFLDQLYNAVVMLNPILDIAHWTDLSISTQTTIVQPKELQSSNASGQTTKTETSRPKRNSIKAAKAKISGLERHLHETVIGQDEAIESVLSVIKRSHVGLTEGERPMGVFLFAGPSGTGKTLLAKELHKYLFDDKYPITRVDCGELQHKHENQKLIGAPPGYIGHEDGGQLTNRLMSTPATVVLLDEVEKAHPDVMNTFLRAFDEGALTDSKGRRVSFKDAIIIMTSNLGNSEIVNSMIGRSTGFNRKLQTSVKDAELPSRDRILAVTEEAIRKHFKPELLNRIDKTVVFNHLDATSFTRIAEEQLGELANKLDSKRLRFEWSEDVVNKMLELGTNPIEGARGLLNLRRRLIEDPIADLFLNEHVPTGTTFAVSVEDNQIVVKHMVPAKKR